jgi:peptidyl-prolyl cis-trans isomerase C
MVCSTLLIPIAFAVLVLAAKDTCAFSPVAPGSYTVVGQFSRPAVKSSADTSTSLSMGIFDAFSKAFENKEYGPPPEKLKATARHILVPTKEEAQIVMKMISNGEQSFEECAQQFSTCPSASKGGSLGSFSPGTMVKEFDQVIFNPDTKIGQVMGPVLTQFGHHVIVVEKRTGGGDWY